MSTRLSFYTAVGVRINGNVNYFLNNKLGFNDDWIFEIESNKNKYGLTVINTRPMDNGPYVIGEELFSLDEDNDSTCYSYSPERMYAFCKEVEEKIKRVLGNVGEVKVHIFSSWG